MIFFVVVSAVFISIPVWSSGGIAYLDNPCHLAELYALSISSTGWADSIFNGSDIRSLHSPFWYFLLFFINKTSGISIEYLYRLALLSGYLLPAVALFASSRRANSSAMSFFIALLYLTLPHVVSGIASPLGGMWTFGIALSVFIWLIATLESPRPHQNSLLIALLVALIGLTHLYILFAATGYLILFALLRAEKRVFLLLASGIGLIGCAAYVYPMFALAPYAARFKEPYAALDMLYFFLFRPDFTFGFVPTNIDRSLFMLENIPTFLVLSLAILASRLSRSSDQTQASWFRIVAAVLALVIFLDLHFHFLFFLPNSWRLIPVSFLLLLLSLCFTPIRPHPRQGLLIGIAVPLLVVLASLSLLEVLPPTRSQERQNIADVWQYLQSHSSSLEKVYVQDTFMTPPYGRDFGLSHVLSLTSSNTGLSAVGGHYGVAPYVNARETYSEFGSLFGERVFGSAAISHTSTQMIAYGARYLLLSDPAQRETFSSSDEFDCTFSTGNFTLCSLKAAPTSREFQLFSSEKLSISSYEPGRVEFSAAPDIENEFVFKQSFHPFWKASPDSVRIEPTNDNSAIRVLLDAPPATSITLTFSPPRWPTLVSAFVTGGLLLLTLAQYCRRKYSI